MDEIDNHEISTNGISYTEPLNNNISHNNIQQPRRIIQLCERTIDYNIKGVTRIYYNEMMQ